MSDFKDRFDQALPDANSALINSAEVIKDAFFGILPSDVRRLLESISRLLGKIDKGGISYPEHLAGSPLNVPERAVELITSVPGIVQSDPESFFKSTLAALASTEEALMRAIGSQVFAVTELKRAQVKHLDKLVHGAEIRERNITLYESLTASAKEAAQIASNEKLPRP